MCPQTLRQASTFMTHNTGLAALIALPSTGTYVTPPATQKRRAMGWFRAGRDCRPCVESRGSGVSGSRVPSGIRQELVLGGGVRRDLHRWFEDTLPLLVAEASVDHVTGKGG